MNTRTTIAAALVSVAALIAPLSASTPAAVASGGCTGSSQTLTGTILGQDGRYVDAEIGFEFRNSAGVDLGASGSSFGCAIAVGYGQSLRMNVTVPPTGATSGQARFSVAVPSDASHLYIEVYPEKPGIVGGLDMTRYGHALRWDLSLPYSQPLVLRLPVVCGAGGTTGGIWGYTELHGQRVQARSVGAWSAARDNNSADPILGWGLGTTGSTGFFEITGLASGQKYTVLVNVDGVTKHWYGVPVRACANTPMTLGF